MKDKILALIAELKKAHDFEDEFYLTYIGSLNEGDISEWHNNHFDDNIELGYSTGQTATTEDIIGKLEAILND